MLKKEKKKNMADINKLVPFILRWEGEFVNDPDDLGGATNKGVTIATWKQVGYDKDGDGDIDVKDLRLITEKDMVDRVLKPYYWDRWRADEIKSQSVANILVDWVWASGAYGIRLPQQLLGVKIDGIVGTQTIAAVNDCDPKELFDKIMNERIAFIDRICISRPANKKFKNGWINRLKAIKFES